MQLPLPLNDVVIPPGAPAWIITFVAEAVRENQTLAENGAAHAVTARIALLYKLVAAVETYLNTDMTVEEAAALLDRHPETIRRAVRNGTLPDRRTNPKARVRIRQGDLALLAAPKRGAYDPITDAQGIAQRRRP